MAESLKDKILEGVSQEKIFSKYLLIPESDIRDCLKFKTKLTSTFRNNDPVPSLSFKYYGTKLICRDFGDIYYTGDVFEIVGKLIGKNCKNKADFVYICEDIIKMLGSDIQINKKIIVEVDETDDIEPTHIQIIERGYFLKSDYKYFYNYFIPRSIVDTSYIPVQTYLINGHRSKYKFTEKDPCYAYINNPNSFKLYFPFRKKNQKRFISNNRIPIENIDKIQVKDYTVLIKAYKDKLLMEYVCSQLKLDNIQFVPMASETAKLTDLLFDFLNKRTNKRIFTMFDNDKCGIDSSNYYLDNYNISPIILGNKSLKDPTDLISVMKLTPFLEMFLNLYKTKINVY